MRPISAGVECCDEVRMHHLTETQCPTAVTILWTAVGIWLQHTVDRSAVKVAKHVVRDEASILTITGKELISQLYFASMGSSETQGI